MVKPNPCAGCRHFRGRFVINRCCNYIFDMGHRRPCPPGSLCTVRQPLPRLPHKEPPVKS